MENKFKLNGHYVFKPAGWTKSEHLDNELVEGEVYKCVSMNWNGSNITLKSLSGKFFLVTDQDKSHFSEAEEELSKSEDIPTTKVSGSGTTTTPTKKNETKDKVSHPSHYTWLKELAGIEVIDITRHMNFNLGNTIKYVLRAGHKSEKGYTDEEKTVEDLKKAIWYLEDEIKRLTK